MKIGVVKEEGVGGKGKEDNRIKEKGETRRRLRTRKKGGEKKRML